MALSAPERHGGCSSCCGWTSNLGLVAGLVGPGREHSRAVVHGHLLVSWVRVWIVSARPGYPVLALSGTIRRGRVSTRFSIWCRARTILSGRSPSFSTTRRTWRDPDFVAVDSTGTHWLLETKGQESPEVAFKDRAADQWWRTPVASPGRFGATAKCRRTNFRRLGDLEALRSTLALSDYDRRVAPGHNAADDLGRDAGREQTASKGRSVVRSHRDQ